MDVTGHVLFRFATALAVGLLIGIERGWRERKAEPGSRTAGIRTYALSGFLGAVCAELTSRVGSPWPLAISMAVFLIVFARFKLREIEHDQAFSVTGVLAAFLTFGLGALAALGDPAAAAAGGVATAVLLAARESLHGWLSRLTWVELRSALLLLTMTIVVLPLLPDRALGPYDSINARQIWIFMILTAAISYAGYIAVKIAGPSRGLLLGGIAGAVVSSTAVTIAFARRSAQSDSALMLAGGALLGGAVSIARVSAIVAVVAPHVLPAIALPASVAAVVFAIAGVAMIRFRSGGIDHDLKLGNPFELLPLVLFALAYCVVSLVSGWVSQEVGSAGLLATTAFSGLFDVDVAVLTAVRTANDPSAVRIAGEATLLALGMNALSRNGCALIAGSWRFGLVYSAVTLAALAAGLVSFVIFG